MSIIAELSVASKTFLVGEYAVLQQSPCILINTTPRFKLELNRKEDDLIAHHDNFNSISPAGKFLLNHHIAFANYNIHFFDPHYGKGGFGASSAQFVLLYLALKFLNNHQQLPIHLDSNNIIIDTYKQYAWHGLGTKPSGADVISQLFGGVCYLDLKTNQQHPLVWPYPDYDFFLVRTGNKVATHEHLRFIKNIDYHPLQDIVLQTHEALNTANMTLFLDTINQYAKTLAQQNLVAKPTQKLLSEFKKDKRILAAKGCGALGIDVIFITFEQKYQQDLKQWLHMRGFSIAASKKDISSAYQIIPSDML